MVATSGIELNTSRGDYLVILNNDTRISYQVYCNQYSGGGVTGNTSHLSVKQFAQYSTTDVPITGGTCLYTVISTSPWSVTCDRTYCIPQQSGGTGDTQYGQTLEVYWPESDSYAPRNAILTFTNNEGYTVRVTKWQAGRNVMELLYPASGGTQSVTTTGTVNVKPNWVSVNPNSTGYDIVAEPNNGSSRQGTVVFTRSNGDFTVYVNQNGTNGQVGFNLSTDSMSFGNNGGVQYCTITNPDNDEWRFVEYPSWITINQINGNTTATVSITAGANTGATRTGYVVLYNNTVGQQYEITVTQNGSSASRTLTVNPTTINASATGGTYTATITYTNRGNDYVVPVCSNPNITVSSVVFTGDTATLTITVPQRTASGTETSTIRLVASDMETTLTIIQSGGEATLNVSPGVLYFNETGGTATFTITSNDDWTIS